MSEAREPLARLLEPGVVAAGVLVALMKMAEMSRSAASVHSS
jgi:hypothetical protein